PVGIKVTKRDNKDSERPVDGLLTGVVGFSCYKPLQRKEGDAVADSGRRRYAVVGAGARAEMFVRALVTDHAERAELVALADTNPARIETHNRWLSRLGVPPVASWPVDDLGARLVKHGVDTLVVTTVDRTHDEYIVLGLEAGCDVITEKPMTVDVP